MPMAVSFLLAATRLPPPRRTLCAGTPQPEAGLSSRRLKKNRSLRAARILHQPGSRHGNPAGRTMVIRTTAERAGIELDRAGIEIVNAKLSTRVEAYIDYLMRAFSEKANIAARCATPDP